MSERYTKTWTPVAVMETTKATIADHLGVDVGVCADQARLGDDLGMDSLDGLDLSVALEEAFGLREIPDAIARTWQTVADVTAGVTTLLATRVVETEGEP